MLVNFLHSAADRIFLGSEEINFLPSNAGSENPCASSTDAVDDGSSFPIAGALGVLSTISTAVQSTVSELGTQEKMSLRECWVFAFHLKHRKRKLQIFTFVGRMVRNFQPSDSFYSVPC